VLKDSQDPSALLSWRWCASSMNQLDSFSAEDGGTGMQDQSNFLVLKFTFNNQTMMILP
jgi:hypothetical protein